MTQKTVLWLLALMLIPAALAQNETGTAADDAADQAAEVVDEPDTDFDPLQGLEDALSNAGEGIADAGEAAGEFIGSAAAAVGDAIVAIAKGAGDAAKWTAQAGAAVAGGVTALLLATGEGITSLGTGTGAGLAASIGLGGSAIAAAASGLATAFSFIAAAYGGLITSLRPDAMPPAAFGAVIATGATGSAAASGWAGWNVLRKWGWVGSIPAVGGFSRIQDDQLLEHPVRSQIFATIQGNPGIHASQLARDVGVGWGTVSHHLDKLQKARLVSTRKVNNQKCFFENGGEIGRSDMAIASAVKGDTAGKISQFVHHHPLTSQKQMAEALGISAALASFHVKKLVNLGVLDKMRHGKETLLTTSGAMRRLLESDRNVAAALQAHAEEALEYGA